MKMMHKPTLRRERALRYDQQGKMDMINNLDKVFSSEFMALLFIKKNADSLLGLQ